MGSVPRAMDCRKRKSRRLGQVEVMERQAHEALELDARVTLIMELIPLGLMHVEETLTAEVKRLAGEKHARKGELEAGCRYGTNPGSVVVGGQRIGIPVPRVRSEHGEIPLRS